MSHQSLLKPEFPGVLFDWNIKSNITEDLLPWKVGPASKRSALACSMFWKNPDIEDPDTPPPSEALEIEINGMRGPGFYANPLLHNIRELGAVEKDVEVVVFLARDMEWLAPKLIESGARVVVMASSSIRHSPGAMWRFLALDLGYESVTVADVDTHVDDWRFCISHTNETANRGLKIWRWPGIVDGVGRWDYKPIMAGSFGVVGSPGFSVAQMMQDFINEHRERKHLARYQHPKLGDLAMFGTVYPAYGFDEFFLGSALYPHLAKGGVRTVTPNIGETGFSMDVNWLVSQGYRHELSIEIRA